MGETMFKVGLGVLAGLFLAGAAFYFRKPDPIPTEAERCNENKAVPVDSQFLVKLKVDFDTIMYKDSSFSKIFKRALYNNYNIDTTADISLEKRCGCRLIKVGTKFRIKPEYPTGSSKRKNQGDLIDALDANYPIVMDTFFPPPIPIERIFEPLPLDTTDNNDASKHKIKVAIIDTGVRHDHDSLKSYIWQEVQTDTCLWFDSIGYDLTKPYLPETNASSHEIPIDNIGHGTHINGIIANNLPAFIDLDLINFKVFGDTAIGELFDAACALQLAIDMEVDVINLSWGYYATHTSRLLSSLFKEAEDKGILIVTSAGNDSLNIDCCPHWPSNFNFINNNVIAVGAKNLNGDSLANYSNYSFLGGRVDISALGEIKSTLPPLVGGSGADTLGVHQGTSMAAALVTRSAVILKAIYMGKDSTLSPKDIKYLLESTGKDFTNITNMKHTKRDVWHDIDEPGSGIPTLNYQN